MSFLIDTDISSAYLKGHGGVQSRFLQYGGHNVKHYINIPGLRIVDWLAP